MADISLPVYGGMFNSTEVVESVNGFPRGNKAVDAAFFAKMIESFYADGILAVGEYGQNGFKVEPSSGMTVTIAPGIAWIRGYMAWMKETQSFVLTAGHSYKIVLRLNTASGEFTLVQSENDPTVPKDTDLIRDLVLAKIAVPSGAAALTSAMITDTRADIEKCGFVTCTVDALQTVPFAENAGSLDGNTAESFVLRSGGTMTGKLNAAPETTGVSAVRNISYGRTVPDVLAEGEVFILVEG